jgi:uncharacterized membrane protein HdeD (DUF308 family)
MVNPLLLQVKKFRPIAVMGILTCILGLTMFLYPIMTLRILMALLGISSIGIGIYSFFAQIELDNVLDPLLFFLLGMFCVAIALLPVTILAYSFAVEFIVVGFVQIGIIAFELHDSLLFVSVLGAFVLCALAIGILLLLAPDVVLMFLLSIFGICLFGTSLLVLILPCVFYFKFRNS